MAGANYAIYVGACYSKNTLYNHAFFFHSCTISTFSLPLQQEKGMVQERLCQVNGSDIIFSSSASIMVNWLVIKV